MQGIYRGVEMQHPEFQKRFIDTLEPGGVAFHAQLHPGVYGPDRARHQRVRQDPEYIDPPMSGLVAMLQRATALGLRSDRLRVLPSVGQNGCDMWDVQTMMLTLIGASGYGETTRFTWYADHADRFAALHGPNLYAREHRHSAAADIPRSSFWLALEAGSAAVKGVRLIDYRDNTPTAYERLRSEVYSPDRGFGAQPTPELEEFVDFWREVFTSDEHSFSLRDALALNPTDYPRL